MAARDLCSHGLTTTQIAEKLYKADPSLLLRHRLGMPGLSKASQPQMLLVAAASGIDPIDPSVPQIRLKLKGWEPTPTAEPTPAAEPPTKKMRAKPLKLKSELLFVAVAKGIGVTGFSCTQSMAKLADGTPSQLRGSRSPCPPAEPPTETMRVLRGEGETRVAASGRCQGHRRDWLELR